MSSEPPLHGVKVDVDGAISSLLSGACGAIDRTCNASEHSFGVGVKKADQGWKKLDRWRDCVVVWDIRLRVQKL